MPKRYLSGAGCSDPDSALSTQLAVQREERESRSSSTHLVLEQAQLPQRRRAHELARHGVRTRTRARGEKIQSRVGLLGVGRVHTACIAPKSATRPLRSAGRGKRVIFAQMAGLLAMPTLLPEGVLSAGGEDAQAVNSS